MEIFSSRVVRRSLYALLAVCLVMDALFAPYDMNADVVSYLDIADLIGQHQWHWAVNAYWHPGYPSLLLVAKTVLHAGVWKELQAVRLLSLAIVGLLFLAVRFAVDSAVMLRETLDAGRGEGAQEPIRRETVGLIAAALTLISVVRELGGKSVRPDVLLAALLVFGAGFLMRVGAKNKLTSYAGVGLCFGLGFLVKSVAFPVFLVTMVLLVFAAGSVKRAAKGWVVAGLVFAALAGPYIGALSRQKGRFSAGDSGGLNYAWYVNGADRFEQQNNDPSRYGRAKAVLKHPSVEVLKDPPIYFYGTPIPPDGQAMPGSETQWFDPSYWNDGLKPHLNLKDEVRETKNGLLITVQYFVLRPQFVVLFVVLVLLGGRWRRREFGFRGLAPVLLLMLAEVCMYMVVYTEPRYIASAALVAMYALVAFVRVPKGSQEAVGLAAAVFLAMLLCGSFTDSMQYLRQEQRAGHVGGGYNQAVFSAAESLTKAPGIERGDTVACLGEAACRDDFYWARLAGVKIRTEMFADYRPLEVWQGADKEKVLAALRSTGAKAVVANFEGAPPPSGWTRLGTGDFFVLYL